MEDPKERVVLDYRVSRRAKNTTRGSRIYLVSFLICICFLPVNCIIFNATYYIHNAIVEPLPRSDPRMANVDRDWPLLQLSICSTPFFIVLAVLFLILYFVDRQPPQ
ncbi:MAG: hypothetical protein H7144_18460 [Burkholderiales bacterium]|nr:hypothetical protein [Phycisphaerae bacterium]